MPAAVKVEVPRALRELGRESALRELGAQAPARVAVAVAEAVRKRVRDKGVTVQRFMGYDDDVVVSDGAANVTTLRAGTRFVASQYPVVSASGRQSAETGVVVYKNSATMHENVVPGSFNVSGGMWAGLSVVAGRNKAAIKFRGRSIGQDTPKTARGKRVYRGRKVSNALKAATVRDKCKVNILALFPSEFAAVSQALTAAIDGAVQGALGAVSEKPERLGSILAHDVLRALRDSGTVKVRPR